jgi:hypothetical protein
MFCDLALTTDPNASFQCEKALLPILKARCDEARERLIRQR